jgi:hypothetical protein
MPSVHTRGNTPGLRCLVCRYECARALLRAGADPNFINSAGDHTLFWAIDGGRAASTVHARLLAIAISGKQDAMLPGGPPCASRPGACLDGFYCLDPGAIHAPAPTPASHTVLHRAPTTALCCPPTAGGVEMIKLLLDYGAEQDAATPRGWTPLSYARAKGKYGATEEQGIYPEVRPAPRVGALLGWLAS